MQLPWNRTYKSLSVSHSLLSSIRVRCSVSYVTDNSNNFRFFIDLNLGSQVTKPVFCGDRNDSVSATKTHKNLKVQLFQNLIQEFLQFVYEYHHNNTRSLGNILQISWPWIGRTVVKTDVSPRHAVTSVRSDRIHSYLRGMTWKKKHVQSSLSTDLCFLRSKEIT